MSFHRSNELKLRDSFSNKRSPEFSYCRKSFILKESNRDSRKEFPGEAIYMGQRNQDNYSCKFSNFCTAAKEESRPNVTVKQKEYKCSICHETFFNLEEIRSHIRELHLMKWTCQICDKSFPSEARYKSHYYFHLNANSEEIFPGICVDEGPQQALLEESGDSDPATPIHKSQKFLKCIFCDFTTADNDTLNFHICSHATIDILQCGECGVCFDHKTQLEKHKVIHKKIYYQCGVCNTKSTSKKVVIKHVREKHLKSSQSHRLDCSSFLWM